MESSDARRSDGAFIKYRPPKEDIIKALTDSEGSFSKAASSFTKPDGTPVAQRTFRTWVDHYNLQYYPDAIKKSIVKLCLDKMVELGVKGGDVQCLKEITRNWGKYVEFEPPSQKFESKITHQLDTAFEQYDGTDLIKMRELEKAIEVQPKEVDDD